MTDKPTLSRQVRWWLLACVLVAVPAAFAQDAQEREMVADLRLCYRRSDRDRPPQFATTAEHGRPTGIQPPRLATGIRVHAGAPRRRIVFDRRPDRAVEIAGHGVA